MINQKLLDLIKSQLSKGVDKETIGKELLGSGWNEEDIQEGFNTANTPVVNPAINPTHSTITNNPNLNRTAKQLSQKTLLIIIIFFVIAGGVSGYFFRNDIPIIKDLIKNKDTTLASEIKQEENFKTEVQQEEQTEKVSEVNSNFSGSFVSATKNEDKEWLVAEPKTTQITSRMVESGEKITVYDSDSIKIIFPLDSAEVKTSEILNIKVHIADLEKLQTYMFIFQDIFISTKPTSSDMVYKFIVDEEYIENQPISIFGSFYDGIKSFESTDTRNIKVTPTETIKEFNIRPEVMVIEKGKSRRPNYEAIFPSSISQIGETDLIKVVIKDPTFASYDNKTNYFKALSKGETVADITYRGITNHMFINVIQYEEPVGDPII